MPTPVSRPQPVAPSPLSLVTLYADGDWGSPRRAALIEGYLRQITSLHSRATHWHRQALAGQTAAEFRLRVLSADLLIVLISDFLLNNEVCLALVDEAQQRGVPLFPVILAPVLLADTAFATLALLPPDGPLQRASSVAQDQALVVVMETLHARVMQHHLPAVAQPLCPFPGLESFDAPMARYFFGREDERRDALARLGSGEGRRRWLQIEGGSGAGKSSLARAGIVPAVRHGLPGVSGWPVRAVIVQPGRSPLRSLARALLHEFSLVQQGVTLDVLLGRLRSADQALRSFLEEQLAPGAGFLLVIDQLEEAFTFPEAVPELPRLDGLLAELLRSDAPLYLVTTVRSDLLRFWLLPNLAAQQNERAHRYYLPPMQGPALRCAIVGPAALVGATLPAELADLIVRDAAGSRQALPLVGHVLRALWDRRAGEDMTIASYLELGGVSGALSSSADGLLAGLNSEDWRERALSLLVGLVRPGPEGDGSYTRRALTRAEVLRCAGDGSDAEAVLLRLSGGRNPDEPQASRAPPRLIAVSDDRVDVIHDQLIPLWTTLSKRLEREHKRLLMRDHLDSAAALWAAAGGHPDGLPLGEQLAYFRGADRGMVRPLSVKFLDLAEARQFKVDQSLQRTVRFQRLTIVLLVLMIGGGNYLWTLGLDEALLALSALPNDRLEAIDLRNLAEHHHVLREFPEARLLFMRNLELHQRLSWIDGHEGR